MKSGEATSNPPRRLCVGAELVGQGVSFRVWAPHQKQVEIVIEQPEPRTLQLAPEADGYFSGLADDLPVGALYRVRLEGSKSLCVDPASRFQPDGPHGPSQVVDPTAFAWTDENWPGVNAAGQVLMEIHIGTFTPEGTWRAAISKLPLLRETGITCLELMPVNDFPGKFGWGYDGVNLFAPTRLYGGPDDFRAFVDAAHAIGIGTILDVVYNHLGPGGNCLTSYASEYFSDKHCTDWGKGINFDGTHSRQVRDYFLANVESWIAEYHLDGFRFDATQAIVDDSPKHILTEMAERATAAAGGRQLLLVAENEPQRTQIVRSPEKGGYGLHALWNDDFHHSAMVVISGHREAYYGDYRGAPQEFISAAKWGYLSQGQHYAWQGKRRGTPTFDLPPTAFVNFLQNHDQIANSGRGLRCHAIAGIGTYKAVTALLLLSPQTPMFFQGQEFAASAPFYYFADHDPKTAPMVRAGRARELSQFPSLATADMQAQLAAPDDPATFAASKIDWSERDRGLHRQILEMHKAIISIRRTDPLLSRVPRRGQVDGAVLGPAAFLLRYFGGNGDDRLLLVNFGLDLTLSVCPEPLLAAPEGKGWKLIFSTEAPEFGGTGTPPPETEQEGWFLTARSTILMAAADAATTRVQTRHKKP